MFGQMYRSCVLGLFCDWLITDTPSVIIDSPMPIYTITRHLSDILSLCCKCQQRLVSILAEVLLKEIFDIISCAVLQNLFSPMLGCMDKPICNSRTVERFGIGGVKIRWRESKVVWCYQIL